MSGFQEVFIVNYRSFSAKSRQCSTESNCMFFSSSLEEDNAIVLQEKEKVKVLNTSIETLHRTAPNSPCTKCDYVNHLLPQKSKTIKTLSPIEN